MAEFYKTAELLKDREEFVRQVAAADSQIEEITANKAAAEANIEAIDAVIGYTQADYPTVPALGNVTGLTAIQTGTMVSLAWDAVADATNYILQQATSADFADAVQIYSGATPAYDIEDLSLGFTYYWRVQAQAANKQPSAWAVVSTTMLEQLATPANLVLEEEDGDVNLFFDEVPFADQYEVYRTEADTEPDDAAIPLAIIGINTYTDESVTSGTNYWYWVKATSSSKLASDFASGNISTEA